MKEFNHIVDSIKRKAGPSVSWTIERGRGATYRSSDWTLYAHDRFPRSSVLAGRPRRTWVASVAPDEEIAHPPSAGGRAGDTGVSVLVAACEAAGVKPDVIDGSTFVEPMGDSLGDLSGLPSSPEPWFDPADAGEAWGEEDY